jgi:branched-chain amino acid transport system substrate-binding protein
MVAIRRVLMLSQSRFARVFAALGLVLLFTQSHADSNLIKIGEINSYKAQPAFLEPYRHGMELALDEINAQGGVNGKKLQLITRDDNASPADALREAQELVSREGVDVLAGSYLSNVGLALTDFSKQKKVFFLAGEPLTDKIVWQNGSKYTFRLRASTYMQASMLAPEAIKLKKKRWALVYPNYEYGQSAAAIFKQLMKAAQPDVEFVTEQATPLGRVDAPSVVQALLDAKPDAIFNVLFGADLAKWIREGNTRGLFEGREVVSLLTGEPEYLDPLREDAPNGWIVTGYPWYGIATPEHQAFYKAYQQRFKDYPRLGSVVGYSLIQALAQGISKAGSTNSDKLVDAFSDLKTDTPFGRITFRGVDHQSTMGAFVGRTKLEAGHGVMVNYRYMDGAAFLPNKEEAAKLRSTE